MKRKTTQTELFEETNRVAEVELIYHNKVKPADRPLVKSSRDVFELLLKTWNKDTIDLQEEFKVILLNRAGRVIALYNLAKGGLTGRNTVWKISKTPYFRITTLNKTTRKTF